MGYSNILLLVWAMFYICFLFSLTFVICLPSNFLFTLLQAFVLLSNLSGKNVCLCSLLEKKASAVELIKKRLAKRPSDSRLWYVSLACTLLDYSFMVF